MARPSRSRPFVLTTVIAAGVSAAGALVAPLAPATARACTIDGTPTVYANGQRAVLSHARFTPQTACGWAMFAFPIDYRPGAAVRLVEDRGALARVLPTEAIGHEWQWTLGDGSKTIGWTVAHVYAHPGAYRIMVSAYYPSWKQYFPFDTVRIVVGK